MKVLVLQRCINTILGLATSYLSLTAHPKVYLSAQEISGVNIALLIASLMLF
jgi:hypothetical protein